MTRWESPRLRRAAAIPSIIAASCVFSCLFATSAGASGGGDGCNPNRTNNYLTGGFTGIQATDPKNAVAGGVRAAIRNYSPFVYNTSGDFTSEWVMLVNSNNDYEQIGWMENVNSLRYTFAEEGLNNGAGGFTDQLIPSDPINTVSTYKVTYQPGTTTYAFFDGSTNDYSVSLSRPAPTSIQVYAETHTQASQTPGGSKNYNVVTSTNTYYPAGGSGAWNDTSGSPSAQPYGVIGPSGGPTDHFDSYDLACTQ
jgi:hypothetical protein